MNSNSVGEAVQFLKRTFGPRLECFARRRVELLHLLDGVNQLFRIDAHERVKALRSALADVGLDGPRSAQREVC